MQYAHTRILGQSTCRGLSPLPGCGNCAGRRRFGTAALSRDQGLRDGSDGAWSTVGSLSDAWGDQMRPGRWCTSPSRPAPPSRASHLGYRTWLLAIYPLITCVKGERLPGAAPPPRRAAADGLVPRPPDPSGRGSIRQTSILSGRKLVYGLMVFQGLVGRRLTYRELVGRSA